MWLNAILLVSGIAAAHAALQCGIPTVSPNVVRPTNVRKKLIGNTSSRISGGTEAVPHSWPWQISLIRNGEGHQCGGSIINNEWMLTAAHCVVPLGGTTVAPASSLQIRIGSHDRHSSAPNDKLLPVSRVIVHPNYATSPAPAHHDLALLKLTKPLEFNAHVAPVCLADGADETVGQRCYSTGWGVTERGGLADRLLQVDAALVGDTECKKRWEYLAPDMICAGGEKGKAVCSADSGGPLVCQNSEGVFKLVGVVSFGAAPCANSDRPSVYARTSAALDWIATSIALQKITS